MYKKFLCVILSVAMILSMVTLPGFAAGAADLSAGCVVYSDVDGNQIRSLTGGAAVKASTTLSNAGSAAADAVVWVATYDNGVLAAPLTARFRYRLAGQRMYPLQRRQCRLTFRMSYCIRTFGTVLRT